MWRDADERHSLLHFAARHGKRDLARAVIDAALDAPAAALLDDVNKNKQTALHLAALAGHLDVVQLLVERGANTAQLAGGKSACDLARDAKHADVVELLSGAAAAAANARVAAVLDFQSLSDDEKRRVSSVAVAMVEALASGDDDDDSNNNNNNNNTHTTAALSSNLWLWRASNGQSLLVRCKFFCDALVDFHNFSFVVLTPQHFAANNNRLALARALLASVPRDQTPAFVNGVANNGQTALHAAGAKAGVELVQLLIDHGADVALRDKSGATALERARNTGRAGVADLLEFAAKVGPVSERRIFKLLFKLLFANFVL